MTQHTDRYIPAETNGGWGFASAVIVLTLALIAVVTYIHKQTYKHPTNVTWHSPASDRGEGASHAAPAAEHGGEHGAH